MFNPGSKNMFGKYKFFTLFSWVRDYQELDYNGNKTIRTLSNKLNLLVYTFISQYFTIKGRIVFSSFGKQKFCGRSFLRKPKRRIRPSTPLKNSFKNPKICGCPELVLQIFLIKLHAKCNINVQKKFFIPKHMLDMNYFRSS